MCFNQFVCNKLYVAKHCNLHNLLILYCAKQNPQLKRRGCIQTINVLTEKLKLVYIGTHYALFYFISCAIHIV